MRFVSIALLFTCTVLTTQKAISQVTIGSNIKPGNAALLELKSNDPDEYNVTSNVGGLLLSRVILKDLTTLEPFINTDVSDYEQMKQSHTGLVVYNVNSQAPFAAGIYLWDGMKWNIMMTSEKSDYSSPSIPNTGGIKFEDALTLPNSYIVPSGGTINIPVMKAYAAWKLTLDNDIDLPDTNLTAELLWQDEKNMVKSVALQKASVDNKSMIQVKTNADVEGNAVIVFKVDNTVRWSWHLWVTNFDPKLENNQKVVNGVTFMNRDLGAISNKKGNIKTMGLLYQWGRKDPFSGSASCTNAKEKDHFTIDNIKIRTPLEFQIVNEDVNLKNSILNPATFYTGERDWYSNSSSTANGYLWKEKDGKKGIYDPCPEGWHVPDQTVWSSLSNRSIVSELGEGFEWEDFGYYAASGRRGKNGTLEEIGKQSFVWSSANFYDHSGYHLYLKSYYLSVQETTNKVYGQSVRCIAVK